TDIAEIVAGNRVRINGAGTVQVIASQPGGGFYGVAQEVSQKLVIKPAILSVTVKDSERSYGEVNPAFEVRYSGFENGDTKSQVDKSPLATTTATFTRDVCTYTITISDGQLLIFTFDYMLVTLSLICAYQNIQFPHVAEVEHNAGIISLDVRISIWLPVVFL